MSIDKYFNWKECKQVKERPVQEKESAKVEPVPVSLEKCAIALAGERWNSAWDYQYTKWKNQAEAVLNSAKQQGAQIDVKD